MWVMYTVHTRIPVTNCACMQSLLMYNGCSFYNLLSSLSESLSFKFMLQWHYEVHWCMSVNTLLELCGWWWDKHWWKLECSRKKWQKVIKWTAIVLKLRMLCTQAELVAGFLVYKYLTFLELPLIVCLLLSPDCIELINKVQSWPLVLSTITKFEEELQAS